MQGYEVNKRDLEEVERSIEARGWAEDIWEEISDAATCSGCQVSISLPHAVNEDSSLTPH